MTGAEKDFGAHVFLQWLALSETNPVPKVIATMPIKEVNDQKLANASIEIEGEESKDNEITIIVSSCRGQGHHPVRQGHRAGQVHHGEGASEGPGGPTAKCRNQCPQG